MPNECNFDSVTYAQKIESRVPFRGVDSIIISWREECAIKKEIRLTRDKRNGKKKLEEEKSLFSEFPRVTLTDIVATQPLLRDCATIVMQLAK